MHVVVINHNQQEYVEPMISALAPLCPTFVFDRCEPVEGVKCVVNRSGEGFLAGKMRDLGANGVDDDILFLDGDKVPQGDIISDIDSLSRKYDAICYGVMPQYETSDMRIDFKNLYADGIVKWQRDGFPYAYGCYSCGLWLSRPSVRKLRELNDGRIFHPAFDGRWGDEDNFLADELGLSGFRIGFSTHVRLDGKFGDWERHFQELGENFMNRILLRKKLLGAKY